MKNLIVTVNGVAYNVTVEEGTVAAAPAAAPGSSGGTRSARSPRSGGRPPRAPSAACSTRSAARRRGRADHPADTAFCGVAAPPCPPA